MQEYKRNGEKQGEKTEGKERTDQKKRVYGHRFLDWVKKKEKAQGIDLKAGGRWSQNPEREKKCRGSTKGSVSRGQYRS